MKLLHFTLLSLLFMIITSGECTPSGSCDQTDSDTMSLYLPDPRTPNSNYISCVVQRQPLWWGGRPKFISCSGGCSSAVKFPVITNVSSNPIPDDSAKRNCSGYQNCCTASGYHYLLHEDLEFLDALCEQIFTGVHVTVQVPSACGCSPCYDDSNLYRPSSESYEQHVNNPGRCLET